MKKAVYINATFNIVIKGENTFIYETRYPQVSKFSKHKVSVNRIVSFSEIDESYVGRLFL